ncbi:DUF4386 domain-containing protein [Rhodanobacter sp. DHG33]|uniref:DUF4386 domain-containing protein n=1 Tax=Rhodanobacter sp. DHG33 TaxID=2775921 RepID=UPI00177A9273|nr:DUF4386 domain-containing protein [Rhodanobacter sp. DHG33]MBD8899486.1 DUF4386 domain-containing protein [Rhodanobacter sp. DHG33]
MSDRYGAAVQIRYARTAGFVYLLLIVLYMGGQYLISHVVGSGDFAERLARIAEGQTLYRAALVLQLLASVFTVLLAYALYVVLKPVNERIARMALYWRLGEAFCCVTAFISFGTLSLQADPEYLRSFGSAKLQAAVDLARAADFASFNIATLLFGFGSTLFFYLFMQTRYIPRPLSAFGVFASVVALLTSLGDLVFPAWSHAIQMGWLPIFLAEITTGIWLLARGVKVASSPVAAFESSVPG